LTAKTKELLKGILLLSNVKNLLQKRNLKVHIKLSKATKQIFLTFRSSPTLHLRFLFLLQQGTSLQQLGATTAWRPKHPAGRSSIPTGV